MTDPRIIPDEELAEWLTELPTLNGLCQSLVCDERTARLIEHGKALAEQVDTLTRERDEWPLRKAFVAMKDRAKNTAEQRLTNLIRAIRDLADEWDGTAITDQVCGSDYADDLRALLPEDGDSDE